MDKRNFSVWLRTGVLLGALTPVACIGNLNANGIGEGVGGGGSTLPGGDGSGGTGNIDGSDPVLSSGGDKLAIRRLLNREFINVYNDLLGPDAAKAVDINALESDISFGGYDNDVSMQSMSASRLRKYMAAASAATNVALANDRSQAMLGCPTAMIDAKCIDKFLPAFGRRLFRRPLTDDELTRYRSLFASERDPLEGAKLMLRGLISSPAFLYQPELGTNDDVPVGYVRLTPLEVATKMSFLLLGTTPSDKLLDAAQNKELNRKEDIAAAANMMLQQPAGKAYLREFASNWLGLDVVSKNGPTGLPNDSAQLQVDMPEETLRLFDDFAQSGAHFANLYAAPYTYVSSSLAPIYGVSSPQNGQWTRVELAGKPRAGFLTQPAILNATGIATFPSILRGKFVLERLLCRSVGSPPANAQQLAVPPEAVGGTEREQLAAHLTNPSCQACHNSIDPPGFGFERYDAVGNYRSSDAKGRALSGEGDVTGAGGFHFVDAWQLGQKLAVSDEAELCLAQKLAQYLLGRALIDSDEALVTRLRANLRDRDLPTTVVDFVTSDYFLTRRVN